MASTGVGGVAKICCHGVFNLFHGDGIYHTEEIVIETQSATILKMMYFIKFDYFLPLFGNSALALYLQFHSPPPCYRCHSLPLDDSSALR